MMKKGFRFFLPFLLALALAISISACSSGTSETDGDVTPDGDDPPEDGDEDGDELPEDGDRVLDGDEPPEDGDIDAEEEQEDDTDGDDTPQHLAFVPAPTPTVDVGTPLNVAFQVIGGTPPYSNWRIALGDAAHGDRDGLPLGELPTGLTLDPDTGVMSGEPQERGFWYFVLAVDDASGDTAKEVFGMRIDDPAEPGPMAQRADAYQEVFEARHLWNGFSFDCETPDDPDEYYRLTTMGDATFVTGNCTMAQAFRYAATKSDEAADILRQQVEGWRFFQALTGVPGLIGRSFVHESWPVEEHFLQAIANGAEHHYAGTGEFEGWYWRGDTSRDQTSGAVLGVAMAYDLADDPAVKQAAADFLTDMMDHLLANNLHFTDPGGKLTAYGNVDGENFEGLPTKNGLNAVTLLAWLKIAHHVSGDERYAEAYEYYINERDYIAIMRDHQWVYKLGGYEMKWYNTYIAWENWFHLMRLEDDPERVETYREIFRDTLWLNAGDTRTPNRRGILEHNAVKSQWFVNSTGERDPEALWRVLWHFSRFPDPPLRDRAVHNSSDPDIVVNPDRPDESLYALPFDRQREDMVRWHRGPFVLDGGNDNGRERTGCDYMLPYWMARYYGLVQADW